MAKKFKLIIAGSRSLHDYKLIDKAMAFANIDISQIKEVVSGGAPGIDSLAIKWAENNKIKTKVFKADWTDMSEPCLRRTNQYGEYNALAGISRNSKMAEYADKLVCIWDGKSRGSENMIETMKKLEKDFHVYPVDDMCGDSENVTF